MINLYSTRYTIALAQFNPKIGDLSANLERHIELCERAKEAGAAMIVFPELSLTGYLLRDLVSDVARTATDPLFKPLLQLSFELTIVCGFVELSDDFILYNTVLVLEDGRIIHKYRKCYLPTYSVFEEKRFFGEGDRIRTYESKLGRHGVLICNDMWHPSLLWLLAIQGAELVIVPSAAPLRGLGEESVSESQRIWRILCESGAKTNTLYLTFVNLSGWQDGLHFWGESALYTPTGIAAGRAGFGTEELLLLEVDRDLLKRERIATPLRRDERVELVAQELTFIRSQQQIKPTA
jgi:predicted amidohydrolase